ncbi:MAG: peptidase S8, partial [Calditrichaeota bacterium]
TVLSSGATNKADDMKASFSNYGQYSVHVYAPGVSIYVPYPGGYARIDGTSFSSPMVAGLAGLVKTKFPSMTNDDIRNRILLTSNNIDYANPQFAGKLGAGRINAFQAVDPDFPVLKVVELDIDDSGGNSVVNPGEIVNFGVWVKSYYTDISGAGATISESDDYVTLNTATAPINGLLSGDSVRLSFQFETTAGIPDGHEIKFVLTTVAGAYTVKDYFSVTAYGDFLTHDTGVLQTSITTQGNIGYTGFGGGQSAGTGFVYNGQDYLYEAGIMIGTGLGTISDCIRGTNPAEQDDDFRTAKGEILSIYSPGNRTFQQGAVRLVDSSALSPIGLSIRQESFADTLTGFKDFIIFKYTITNLRSTSISNLHVGMFADWNINSGNKDFASYDSVNIMGVVKNLPTGGSRIVAVKLLSQNSSVSYRTINNSIELADGFNILEKWNFLTGGIQTTELGGKDVSVLISEGPFQVMPDSAITVGFALIAAQSDANLLISAQNAQLFWDDVISDIDKTNKPHNANDFQLSQNYPNPFNPATTIEF